MYLFIECNNLGTYFIHFERSQSRIDGVSPFFGQLNNNNLFNELIYFLYLYKYLNDSINL